MNHLALSLPKINKIISLIYKLRICQIINKTKKNCLWEQTVNIISTIIFEAGDFDFLPVLPFIERIVINLFINTFFWDNNTPYLTCTCLILSKTREELLKVLYYELDVDELTSSFIFLRSGYTNTSINIDKFWLGLPQVTNSLTIFLNFRSIFISKFPSTSSTKWWSQ